MLDYKFNSKLITTNQLLKELNIKLCALDFWKTQWRKRGFDCWEMGMRLIGKKAYWDPIVFSNWVAQNKLKNKPTTPEQILDEKTLMMFVKKNIKLNGTAQI